MPRDRQKVESRWRCPSRNTGPAKTFQATGSPMPDSRTALVLGATGGVGGETAAALLRHGWRVTALARDSAKAAGAGVPAGITWTQGDALDQDSVIAGAR